MSHTPLHLARSFWYSAGLSFLYSILLLSWLLLKPGSQALFLAGDNIGQTLGLLGAVLLCGVGLRRLRRDRLVHPTHLLRSRHTAVPILLGLGIFCQFLGQAIYTYYEQGLHQAAPFPSWADACFLSAYPFLLLGLLLLPARPLSTTARSRVLLDGLLITVAIITCSWYFILGPTLLQGSDGVFATVVGAAYPFFDLVLAFCLLLLTFRASVPAFRPIMVLLSLAFVVIIVTDSLFDYLTLQNAYATGGVMDLGWVVGYLLVGLAVQAFCSIPSEGEANRTATAVNTVTHSVSAGDASLWLALVPYILVPAVLLLGVYVWHAGGNDILARGTYLGGAVLLGLVLVRQVLAVRETHRLNGKLHGANARLEALSTTDPLTELANHRALLEGMEKETAGARRYGQTLSILFFDGDHFKQVNDTYGHSIGDAVLQELGRRGRESLRGGDTLGRYGGEEFLVLLPQTDTTQACQVAERLRVTIAAHPLVIGLVDGGIPLTISVGVATFPTDGQTAGEVVDKADQAMYWAKRLGRNQIRTALEAQRASQDSALAATILNLERRDALSLDGLSVEQSVRANQLSTIQSLMGLLDLRDQGISTHSYQVSDLAAAIAQELGMEQAAVFAVSTAGLLHDIGKIAIPDLLLHKEGVLSATEWALIKQHPELGAQILDVSPYLHNLMPAVGHHHENWDGTGYPAALAGENIPLAARIIRVSEAYWAMMTTRSYQARRSAASARAELQRCSGTHFDPTVVQAALRVLARSEEEASAGRWVDLVS